MDTSGVDPLREQAVALRRAGVGAKRIAAQLGVRHNRVATMLRGEPPPASLGRLRAKDEHREAAVALRREGRTYDEIQLELGVSKGSLSLWLRELPHPTPGMRAAAEATDLAIPPDSKVARALREDGWLLREIAEELGVSVKTAHTWTRGIPVPPRATHGRSPEATRAMARARWDSVLAEREAERSQRVASFANTVGILTERERDLVAAVAYWCEGSKRKPWRRQDRLTFINSDADLIQLWLGFLRSRDVGLDRLRLTVNIHESADVAGATRYWAGVVGCAEECFTKPVLKRHVPKTTRKNVGDTYVGCLTVNVRGGRLLYQEIEGVWRGVARALRDPGASERA